MMNPIERKLLKALYEKGKAVSKGHVFNAYPYTLTEILPEINETRESVVEILKGNPYIEWNGNMIVKLTPKGLAFCLDEFDRRPMGFIK